MQSKNITMNDMTPKTLACLLLVFVVLILFVTVIVTIETHRKPIIIKKPSKEDLAIQKKKDERFMLWIALPLYGFLLYYFLMDPALRFFLGTMTMAGLIVLAVSDTAKKIRN
jgi:hypothetical protein